MKVGDIAQKDVYCASPSMNLGQIAAMMKRHGVGALPVCNDDGKLIGMITDRDIVVSCVAADLNPCECKTRDFMTSNPVAISTDTDMEEAARIMGKEQIRRLPIVDEGTLVGMLSLGDIAVSMGNDALVAETLRKISSPTKAALVC
ncbi:MAG: CBS domain-containing protein [Chloroflexi bacterium]|nr:CBS domain-containing protein [Chloroflexota bacterium]